MNIIILNGSPKGSLSITLQYMRFLEKKLPQHTFQTFHVAHDIRKIESDETAFLEIITRVKEADGVVWAFPLYYFLVSAQYKRFIELIWERKAEDSFQDKYTIAFSTSIHVFDHMAHNYIHGICDDLNMKFIGSYSADMYDLLKETEQKRLLEFGGQFLKDIEKSIVVAREYLPVQSSLPRYEPQGNPQSVVDQGDKEVLVLTDCLPDQTNLVRMAEKLQKCFKQRVKVVNLSDISMKGGCLGCIRCGYDNVCVYEGKDGYISFFQETVKKADIIVIAGAIRDRYLSSRWKMFFDRSFFNNHVPSLVDKQIGFLISGPLSQIPNLRQIFEGYVEVQQGNLVGIVTDEQGSSSETGSLIEGLARHLVEHATLGYSKPSTFLGAGSHKILRDAIYGGMRFPFQADHAFFRKSGAYDFPQKDCKSRMISAFLILLTKIPAMRKKIYTTRMMDEMVKPLKNLVERMP